MKSIVITLHDQAVEVRYPETLQPQIDLLFGEPAHSSARPWRVLSVKQSASGRYSFDSDGGASTSNLATDELSDILLEAVTSSLIENLDSGVALHAASVGWGNNAVVIAGPSGCGKSSLTACLIAAGFDFLTDELTLLQSSEAILGFPRPLLAKRGAEDLIKHITRGGGRNAVPTASNVLISWDRHDASAQTTRTPALIVFPRYVPGASFELTRVTAARAVLKLVESNLNGRNFADHGLGRLTEFARKVPAITFTYGHYNQLHRVADLLAKFSVRPAELQSLVSAVGRVQPMRKTSVEASAMEMESEASHVETAAPQQKKIKGCKLTIGMATYDDYDGVYFTLQSIRMYHPDILDQVEFLVIDNNPTGASSQGLVDLQNWIPNYRYVPRTAMSGTAIRDWVFREASGEFVLCIDCHILIVPGALRRLLDYFDAHPGTNDLLQGPLVYDDLKSYSTHFKPGWEAGMYGTWDTDPAAADPDAPPFEIPMQGLGLFACRRSAWPGFNPAFRGFGGEEGYIHEKFRQRGGNALCLPFLRWMHRFHRPRGTPYVNVWEDRVWNYLVGFRELGWDTQQVIDHFKEHLGDAGWAQVAEQLGPAVLDPEPQRKPDLVQSNGPSWSDAVQHRTGLKTPARPSFGAKVF